MFSWKKAISIARFLSKDFEKWRSSITIQALHVLILVELIMGSEKVLPMERVCFGWEILAIKLHCFGGIPTAAAKGV
jgi:hypothetical protein